MTASLRAHQAMQAAGLHAPERTAAHAVRVTNALNEVWRYGDYIVRVNPRPGARRLQREARLLASLPPEVRAPIVVGAGDASWGEWQVTRRLPGVELSRAWRSLDRHGRRRAITELARVMRALHSIPAGAIEPPAADSRRPEPHPLPADVLLPLLGGLIGRPGIDRGIITAAAERVIRLADVLDSEPTTLIHGDLHLENVLTDDTNTGDVSGLIDFEWARCGPPDLDLDILLHSLADPSLHVESGGSPLVRSDFDEVLGWMRKAYPELFAHPRLADRLWVYRLAYDAQALASAEDGPVDATHHPYQRIVRLVEGRSDLGWFVGT